MKLNLFSTLLVFKKYLQSAGYRKQSIATRLNELEYFYEYLKKQYNIADLRDTKQEHIKRYIHYLNQAVSEKTGKAYAKSTIGSKVSAINLLFKSLYVNELILVNPAKGLCFPKTDDGKREVFTEAEIAQVLDNLEEHSRFSLRDRAMYELMYSSGLRCSEVANMNIGDIDFTNRLLLIRQGKWGKDRVVPISQVAMKFLKDYLSVRKKREEPVFLCSSGRLRPNSIGRRFTTLLTKLGKKREHLSAHSVRHATATHLLEHGANVRYVQELLGHESIETTVQYTHMLYDSLKRVYRSFHPRENEYYREVDQEYRDKVEELANYIKKAKIRKHGKKWLYQMERED